MEDAIAKTDAQLIQSESVRVDLVHYTKETVVAEQLVKALTIKDDGDNALANDLLAKVKTLSKNLEAERVAKVTPFNTVVTRINGLFKIISGSLVASEGAIKKKMTDYAIEKEKQRKIDEARIREENDRKRREAEEEHRKAVEAAKAQQVGTDKPVETPKYVAPAQLVIPKAQTTTSGVVGKSNLVTTWKGEAADPKEICKAIGAGLLPVEMVSFSVSEMNKYAKDVGIEGMWNGVKVIEVKSVKAGR